MAPEFCDLHDPDLLYALTKKLADIEDRGKVITRRLRPVINAAIWELRRIPHDPGRLYKLLYCLEYKGRGFENAYSIVISEKSAWRLGLEPVPTSEPPLEIFLVYEVRATFVRPVTYALSPGFD